MKLRRLPAALASFALLSTPIAPAQQAPVIPQFTDPANLRGERVKPRDGRELPIDQGARGLEQMLRRLNTRASLMLIVAHPDDEDGGMLTYYSRGLGARVAMLTLTRGEGGQNAMTGDFEDALGLLRTQELLSADRYLGVDQFFGTEVDFGFSKTKEEAFKKWTHERVLYDAVRSIRLYRPLVIAAVFIGGVTDGHGQHQVSGQIAQEAFKAAADPTVFPDMIAEGILPWQALKVYARVPTQSITDKGLFDYATGKYTAPRFENYVTGEVTTTPPSADVIVHEGTTDPLLSDDPAAPPRTYVQFARIGLGMQKSQIGGGVRVPPAGVFDVAYHRYGSKLPNQPDHETSFFDGIDTSIEGIGTLSPAPFAQLSKVLAGVSAKVKTAALGFNASQPANVAQKLAEALKSVDDAISLVNESKLGGTYAKQNVLHELQVKRVQVNDALVIALGLKMKATSISDDHITSSKIAGDIHPGDDLSATVEVNASNPPSLRILAFDLKTPFGRDIHSDAVVTDGDNRQGMPIPNNGYYFRSPIKAKIPPRATPTEPYFWRSSVEQPFYNLRDYLLQNAPATPPPFPATVKLSYQGSLIYLSAPVVQASNEPVSITPRISLSVLPSVRILFGGRRTITIEARVRNSGLGTVPATVLVQTPDDWIALPQKQELPTLPGDYSEEFRLSAPPNNNDLRILEPIVETPEGSYTVGFRQIGYPGIPTTNYYTPATVRIVPVDLNLPATHRIAYLPGTGDAVPEALVSINLKPDILTVADLTAAKLAQYDTVLLGVRTYSAHPDLHGAPTQALLDYARNGGNVLVEYQTAEFTGADAPYPLTLGYSAEKVVDETDPVQLLDAKAPFLTTPNKITPTDFDNWVEERGHGFLGTWDSHYIALTETHDQDQDPQRGGLITTPLGKGRWTYCAFALYRQLPEAVPGAYRLFVNLLTPAPK
jgi:LmbE family N-acetylglucosaminyl deacetylase